MADSAPQLAFVNRLTGSQSALFAYICALVGRPDEAEDVLQRTNVILWEKQADFDAGRDFLAWARGIARFEVLAWRRERNDQQMLLGDELLNRVAARIEQRSDELDRRRAALRRCLERLTADQRSLLDARYATSTTVGQLADSLERPVKAVYQRLFRVRATLQRCVRASTQSEGA